MTVRFVLGRSGSGKTHYCLEEIRSQLLLSPQGRSLVLLVPEQATFQMEQALLADKRLCGYNRALILSFERLTRQILWETGPPSLPQLSEFGKQMVLRRQLQQRQEQLTIFARAAGRSGFIVQLSGMIRQLRQYRHSPEQLLLQREKLLQRNEPRLAPLAEKLSDLALIYQAYLDYIKGRFVDPDDFLDLAGSRCPEVRFLKDSHLWVDGFAGFTPQQLHCLGTLIACVERAEITLCLDPDSRRFRIVHDHPDNSDKPDLMDLFHPTLQTYQRLSRLIAELSVPLEPPLILPLDKKPDGRLPGSISLDGPGLSLPRFRGSTALALLERNLFAQNQKNNSALPNTGTVTGKIPVRDIVIVEASRRRREVDAVARHILVLCRENNYRFRDIAVILRDFTHYQDLLETTFRDYDIAYFIDRRRGVHHHPLIELLRSAVQIIISNFRSEYVIDYLKTDLAPLPRNVVDSLENYVLAHGIQSDGWLSDWRMPVSSSNKNSPEAAFHQPTSGQLNQYRRQALAPLLRMRESLFGEHFQPDGKLPVRDITTQLVNLLESINAPQTLSQWHRQACDRGDLDSAQTHEQLYKGVIDVLDDMVEALGDCLITLGEYFEILCSALEQMTLRLIPPYLDQVLIGTIERSRHPRIRAAFVLGVNEKNFPRVSLPDTFFTDAQRELLGQGDFELAPSSTEKLMHERYLAYIAVTRPREFLWISYPIADEDAGSLNPSLLIENIYDALGDVPFVRLSDNRSQPDIDGITTVGQLSEQLALAFSVLRKRPSEPIRNCRIDPIWTQLYHYASAQPGWAEVIRHGLGGLTYRNSAQLDQVTIDRLFSQTFSGSVSQLETFAACPFQHFARYVLRLRQRDELKLGMLDLGSFYHAALYHIFQQMQRDGLDWRDLTDDKLDGLIEKVVDRLINQDRQFAALKEQSHRNTFMFMDALGRLNRFCRSLRIAASAGKFRQREAELKFACRSVVPALEIALSHGRRLSLDGRIDRVDTCLRDDGTLGVSVIDYKSSARSFPFDRFYHGLSLQLISYLLALQDHYSQDQTQPSQPAAALYLPIHQSSQSQPESPPEDIFRLQESPQDKPHKATGLINSQWMGDLDGRVTPGNNSSYFAFGINQNGSIRYANRSGVVTPDQMAALLAHGRKMLALSAENILHGEIAVKPYRLGEKYTPCAHCDYQSLCRFDYNCDSYRQLTQYPKQEVLQRIMDE